MALTQGAKPPEAGRCSVPPGQMGQFFPRQPELVAKGTRLPPAPQITPNNPFPSVPEPGEQSPRAKGKFQGDGLSPAPLR